MRICGPAIVESCKMRMVLRIFLVDVTGKMRMWTQYYKLKKNTAFRWNLLRHGITCYICQIQN